jgi:hypothetical protein
MQAIQWEPHVQHIVPCHAVSCYHAVSCVLRHAMQLVGRPGFQCTRDVSDAIRSVLGVLRVPRAALGISASSKGAVAGEGDVGWALWSLAKPWTKGVPRTHNTSSARLSTKLIVPAQIWVPALAAASSSGRLPSLKLAVCELDSRLRIPCAAALCLGSRTIPGLHPSRLARCSTVMSELHTTANYRTVAAHSTQQCLNLRP